MTAGTIRSSPLSSLHCNRFILVHGGMLRHLLRLIISLFAVVILRVNCFQHPQNLKRLSFLHPMTESMPPSTTAVPLSVQEALSSDRPKIAILRVQGPDCKGIVAAFAQVLYGHGCGIVESEQHTDDETNRFFQRIVFDYSEMVTDRITLNHGINEVTSRLGMEAKLNWNDERKKVAIMVSKYDHVLWEVLLRHQAGELDCDISCIISNHPDLQEVANTFRIPFHVYKMNKETKADVEKEQLRLLKEDYNVDLVILARYMQIISNTFCEKFHHQVINIHHSFLPAFIGAKPYHRAHQRGVKLIGATAHYATADLDEGPIIEQDISRVTHKDAVKDLIRKGRILEKNTLVDAVKAHLEDRIIVYDNKCVVFDT